MNRKELAEALRKEAATCSAKQAAAAARMDNLRSEIDIAAAACKEAGQRYSDLMSAAEALEAMSK